MLTKEGFIKQVEKYIAQIIFLLPNYNYKKQGVF
jgi:hypothetical protein